MPTAGCRSSGRSISSSRRRRATCRRATGRWRRGREGGAGRRTGRAPPLPTRWTNGTTAPPDVAVAALARTAGAQEVFERFCRYGARDFRDIGHKAIYVANSWRTLQTIGWQHAEPVLRSLAYALLEHEGENPAGRDGDRRPSRAPQPKAGPGNSRRLAGRRGQRRGDKADARDPAAGELGTGRRQRRETPQPWRLIRNRSGTPVSNAPGRC